MKFILENIKNQHKKGKKYFVMANSSLTIRLLNKRESTIQRKKTKIKFPLLTSMR